MKITVGQLRRVIKEEISRVMSEGDSEVSSEMLTPEQIQQMKDEIRPNLENYVRLFGELSMLNRTILPELPQAQKDKLNTESERLNGEVNAAGAAIDWGNLPALNKVELWSETWGKKDALTPGYKIWYSSEPHSAYTGAGLDSRDFYEAENQRYLARAKENLGAGRGGKKRR